MDEAGTPFCVTVDFETLDDDTVTLRHRDSTEQVSDMFKYLQLYTALSLRNVVLSAIALSLVMVALQECYTACATAAAHNSLCRNVLVKAVYLKQVRMCVLYGTTGAHANGRHHTVPRQGNTRLLKCRGVAMRCCY
jgi:Anticodon binding domain